MKQECGRDEKSLNFETTTSNNPNSYLLNSSLASSSHHQPTSTSSRTYFKVFLGLSLVLLILCNLLVTTVNCMPSPEVPLYDTPDEVAVPYIDGTLNTDVKIESKRGSICSTDEAARNVCERCAKATKAPSAIRLCCDDGNTKDWCQRILNFKLVVEAATGMERNNRYIRRVLGDHLKRMT